MEILRTPVCQARFSQTNFSYIARFTLLPHHKIVLLLIACFCTACESGLVRKIHYYEEVGDIAAARENLEVELMRRPSNTEARFLLGKVLFQEASFEAGRAAFDIVGKQTARYSESIEYLIESNYRMQMSRGIDALEANDATTATTHLRYATLIRPEYNAGHRTYGHALLLTGQFSAASEAYLKAVIANPEDFESWANLSEIAFNSQEYKRAVSYGVNAVNLDPSSIPVQRRLAHAHVHLRDHDQAVSAFQKLLTLSLSYDDTKDFAYFLFNQGDYEISLPYLEQLATNTNPPMDLLRTLGETYSGLELFKKVITVNERILERLPEDRAAIGNLIAAHERLGQFNSAQDWQIKLARLGGKM